jgi:predicted DNA-binding ArsR family transcriptional regulator
MGRIEIVQDEYERLTSLFVLDSLDESKKTLVNDLLQQMAFMKVELSILKEQISNYGAVQVTKSGRQRQSEAVRYYTKLVASFSSTLKTINSILGKTSKEDDDELDKFLKGI